MCYTKNIPYLDRDMQLSYCSIDFKIQFKTEVFADTNPLFILRSMIGKNLRSMCCISKKTLCPECLYNKTCAYSYLFETVLPQDNAVLPGRNRGSHPYSFSQNVVSRAKEISEFDFTITLFGKAVEYLPYMYAAVVRSGNDGLFKSRTQFSVTGVFANGKNILLDENHLDTDFDVCEWKAENALSAEKAEYPEKEILVELRSSLRFKVNGKYTTDFSAADFMKCLYRRAKTLCDLYGTAETSGFYEPDNSIYIEEKNLFWKDLRHYSARQKTAMELGGVAGTFKLKGNFSPFDLALLEFAKIAGAGKNTNFGLGQMDYWVK